MPRSKKATPEHDNQCTVVQFWDYQYPKLSGCLMASMNGAALWGNPTQRATQMAKHKKAGMKVGAADLFLAVPRGTYHGLFIEMKAPGSTASSLSTDQAIHLLLMRTQGYMAVWCAGADDAISAIKEYMALN